MGATYLIKQARSVAFGAFRVPEFTMTSFEGVQGGQKLKPFTEKYYRENLKKLTGIYPPKTVDAHHVFSQAHKEFFFSKGVNIHDPKYLTWWKNPGHWGTYDSLHRKGSTKKGADDIGTIGRCGKDI